MILTVNAGSSSLKIGIFAWADGTLNQLVHCGASGIGGAGAVFSARLPDGRQLARMGFTSAKTQDEILACMLSWVKSYIDGRAVRAVGHRVVHGGRLLVAPTIIDDKVLAVLEGLVDLAPLHQPFCLAAIAAVTESWPGVTQIACVDTAFHRTMPKSARRFAVPRALYDEGIERYGFHGLSYEYIAGRLRMLAPALVAGRVVVAHLGSGASLCAMADGRSQDTTMGMTPLDGLPMATRCGAIDPGVLLYLQRTKGLSIGDIEDLLYRRSGLLGVSGESGDMSVLSSSASTPAHEAIELFAAQVARQTCMMACALGGLDGLVFSGGIGEHMPSLRQAVCAQLAWLGVNISLPERDGTGARCISAPQSGVAVWVIPTDEERMIAEHTSRCVGVAA